ncbi:MAG TPA: hypothetical protein VK957_12050 [Lunatimonas sp.]|nr:hypothetical protein [Lunatimonas sp.]
MELKEMQSKPHVAVMIYTACGTACPRLVADMRMVKERVSCTYRDQDFKS